MSVLDDLALLGLTEKATPDEVKTAYRKLAAIHHPDKGGDPAKMSELSQAYKRALAHASEPKFCDTCFGKGKIKKVVGFSVTELLCPTCKGAKTV